jgi:hypothetical protein
MSSGFHGDKTMNYEHHNKPVSEYAAATQKLSTSLLTQQVPLLMGQHFIWQLSLLTYVGFFITVMWPTNCPHTWCSSSWKRKIVIIIHSKNPVLIHNCALVFEVRDINEQCPSIYQ